LLQRLIQKRAGINITRVRLQTRLEVLSIHRASLLPASRGTVLLLLVLHGLLGVGLVLLGRLAVAGEGTDGRTDRLRQRREGWEKSK